MTYDSLLRLDRITYHNGQTTGAFKLFSDFRYTRDAYGNIGPDVAGTDLRAVLENEMTTRVPRSPGSDWH